MKVSVSRWYLWRFLLALLRLLLVHKLLKVQLRVLEVANQGAYTTQGAAVKRKRTCVLAHECSQHDLGTGLLRSPSAPRFLR